MGAISSTTEPDADRIIHTNFTLSRDLFRWCAEHKRRLIYASSAATYGDGALGFDGKDDLASLTALRPLNAYGWSKALFDLFAVREVAKGLAPTQWAGLKFFNVYGPNEDHKDAMKSVVAKTWPEAGARRRPCACSSPTAMATPMAASCAILSMCAMRPKWWRGCCGTLRSTASTT